MGNPKGGSKKGLMKIKGQKIDHKTKWEPAKVRKKGCEGAKTIGFGQKNIPPNQREARQQSPARELPGPRHNGGELRTQGFWLARLACRIKRARVERLLSTSARKRKAVTRGRP